VKIVSRINPHILPYFSDWQACTASYLIVCYPLICRAFVSLAAAVCLGAIAVSGKPAIPMWLMVATIELFFGKILMINFGTPIKLLTF